MTGYDVIVVGGGPAGAASAFKCQNLGLSVLLIERMSQNRHKPCGGILPNACADILLDEFGTSIPKEVMCSPERLGLFYVPPSGRQNGGKLKNYELLNVNRDLFDSWLCGFVEGSGVKVLYDTEFLKKDQSENILVLNKKRGKTFKLSTRYLIGADGVFSRVRGQIYGGKQTKVLPILQEYWRAEGDFDECFYTFLRGAVTPNYGYVTKKNGLYLVGIGVPKKHPQSIHDCMDRFKDWLTSEFDFNPLTLMKRESWAIPYGFVQEGLGNTILVGDAAGICNSFSGEGVRLAIENSISVEETIKEASVTKKNLARIYLNKVEGLAHFVRKTHEFTLDLTDEGREDFIKSELSRKTFSSF